MATTKLPESFTWSALAAVDLSAKLHYIAKVTSAGTIDLNTAGAPVLGTLYEVAEAGRSVSVQFGGIGKVIAGATIAAGDRISSDASGKARVALVGDWTLGLAISGAAANGFVSFIYKSGMRSV